LLKEAIILAGGFGTRLQSVVNDVPKPMAPINNIPFCITNIFLQYIN
jgi:D-glycero-alpha-D-manno-heptose 1-phosphate guanylyltransferase